MAVLRSSEVFYVLSISAEPKIFLHLSPNFGAVMLWATDMLRPATISGSSPRPIALKRVAHAIHPRFKPRNDPIASKDVPKKQVSDFSVVLENNNGYLTQLSAEGLPLLSLP